MGRELKRVPMDFDAPLNKTWAGYINNIGRPCPEANKTCFDGSTGGAKWLEAMSRFLMLLGEQGIGVNSVDDFDARRERDAARGCTYPHPYVRDFAQMPTFCVDRERHEHAIVPITEELTAITTMIAGRSPEGRMGHDAIDSWKAYKFLKRALKLPKTWGECPVCHGKGLHPDDIAAHEAWKTTKPPTGDGYQLWSTTSDAPTSPVFATLWQLCVWCETNATIFADITATAQEWEKSLGGDGHTVYDDGNGHIFL